MDARVSGSLAVGVGGADRVVGDVSEHSICRTQEDNQRG